jgi:excisionase family DNA binding protein
VPGYLAVNQTRQLLNVSKSELYEKVHRGTIPYVYVDGTIRFDPIGLAAWLRENQVGERFQLPKAA